MVPSPCSARRSATTARAAAGPAKLVATMSSTCAARRLPPWKEGLATVGPTAAVGVLAPTVAIALGGSGWERPTAHTMALVHALLALLGGASVLDGARRCE